jgi:hypothetical protein
MFLLICIPYGKLLRFGISKADIKSNRHFGMHPFYSTHLEIRNFHVILRDKNYRYEKNILFIIGVFTWRRTE